MEHVLKCQQSHRLPRRLFPVVAGWSDTVRGDWPDIATLPGSHRGHRGQNSPDVVFSDFVILLLLYVFSSMIRKILSVNKALTGTFGGHHLCRTLITFDSNLILTGGRGLMEMEWARKGKIMKGEKKTKDGFFCSVRAPDVIPPVFLRESL